VSRFAVKSALRKVKDFTFVGEAKDGQSALDQLSSLTPGVVLVDIGLPDIDGIELTKQIKELLPKARVLMLTASDDQNDIFDALDAGAEGYILKAENGEHGEHTRNLEAAIRSVRLGAVWLDPAIARLVLKSSQRPPHRDRKVEPISLSHQERNVLGQVAESNCQDGVCLVDPDFLQKLRRFGNTARRTTESALQAP
jgi:DNA-binding NarL/FixJ family response regulator